MRYQAVFSEMHKIGGVKNIIVFPSSLVRNLVSIFSNISKYGETALNIKKVI
jgi:hypothetical protein